MLATNKFIEAHGYCTQIMLWDTEGKPRSVAAKMLHVTLA